MDNAVAEVDGLVREYLIFRGFTQTVSTLDGERRRDKGHGFNVDKIIEYLITHVENFDLTALLDTWEYLESRFFSQMSAEYVTTMRRLGDSLRRYFVIHSVRSHRPDIASQFFEKCSDRFGLLSDPTWSNWFVLPFTRSPEEHVVFQPFFSKQWHDIFITSLHNFLVTVFTHVQPPKLLRFRQERVKRQGLESELRAARAELARLRSQLSDEQRSSEMPVRAAVSEAIDAELGTWQDEEEEEEASVSLECVLSGHTGAVTCTKFSPPWDDGTVCLASGSADGTVRVWEVERRDGGTVSSAHSGFDGDGRRRATILCDSPVLDLDWDARSSRMLFCGTADGRVRAWNAEGKCVMGEVEVGSAECPSVTAICASPTTTSLVCGCSSTGEPVSGGMLGTTTVAGTLSSWNMRTMQHEQTFRLDPNPAAAHAIAMNHNGAMVYTGTSDGMVRVFDVRSAAPLMGWPAHEGACGVTALALSSDETSVFSVGSDGRVIQWSIHIMGRALRTLQLVAAPAPGLMMRLALDNQGRFLAVTGDSGFGPAVLVNLGDFDAAPVPVGSRDDCVAVDWHPVRAVVVTGGEEDVSVYTI